MKKNEPISDGKVHEAIPIRSNEYQEPIGESENEMVIPSSFTVCSTDDLADRMVKDVWAYHESRKK